MAISGGHTPGQSGHVTDHNLIDAAIAAKAASTALTAEISRATTAEAAAITTAGTNADTKIAAQHSVDNSTYVAGVVAGAGSDPTGAADSTTALNAALTAATGKVAHLPKGTYLLSGISIPAGTKVYCYGSTLKAKTNAG